MARKKRRRRPALKCYRYAEHEVSEVKFADGKTMTLLEIEIMKFEWKDQLCLRVQTQTCAQAFLRVGAGAFFV